MKLRVRGFTADNMVFGENARYASVLRGVDEVKEFSPPFARLRAYLYVIRHFGGRLGR